MARPATPQTAFKGRRSYRTGRSTSSCLLTMQAPRAASTMAAQIRRQSQSALAWTAARLAGLLSCSTASLCKLQECNSSSRRQTMFLSSLNLLTLMCQQGVVRLCRLLAQLVDMQPQTGPDVHIVADVRCSESSLEEAIPPEGTTASDAALPHVATSAAEGRSPAISCEGLVPDTASMQPVPAAMTAGGGASMNDGTSHLGKESQGGGGSLPVCSPFARTSWQEGKEASSPRPQGPPHQQQQHAHWEAGSISGTGPGGLVSAPATGQPAHVGSQQEPAGDDGDGRTASKPAQSLPAMQACARAAKNFPRKAPHLHSLLVCCPLSYPSLGTTEMTLPLAK